MPDVPEQTGVHLLVRVGTGGHIAETFVESVAAMEKAAGHRVYGEAMDVWQHGRCARDVTRRKRSSGGPPITRMRWPP